jgi:hypothetical protein
LRSTNPLERVNREIGRRSDGHCCICPEGATDEYLSGGWFHSEGYENGSKRPIVKAV